ncbi:hypothetical protein JCM8097_006063 [Rhodosporidiobolus ruineniae]
MLLNFETNWPFPALLLVAYRAYDLFTRPYPGGRSRSDDPKWWMHAGLPLYVLHMFEEYGLDLFGRHFEFYRTLCRNLGYPSTDTCPIRPWATNYVNVFLVCLAAIRARPSRNWRGPGANYWGVVGVNGVFHVAMSVKEYSDGSPCLRRTGALSTSAAVVRAVLIGVVAHAGLFSGLILRSSGKMGDLGFILWELADWTIPLSLAFP